MTKLLSGVLLFFFVFGLSFTHRYYFSIAQMEYNEKEQSLQVVLNAHGHNIEMALSNFNDEKITLESDDFEKKLSHYLSQHFVLRQANNKPIDFLWVGYELERDDIQCYFEFCIVKREELILENSILLETYPRQNNITNLKDKDEISTLVFTKEKVSQEIKFLKIK